MSGSKGFRISINLSNFFHDHRSRARVFINNDIETINDLQDRVAKIFNIRNFHLTSQNEYLPPSEDVKILQKDDIIWVIQNAENNDSVSAANVSTKKFNKKSNETKKRSMTSTSEYIEEELRSPKKKKKKKHDLEKNSSEHVPVPDELKEERKKKRKRNSPGKNLTAAEYLDDITINPSQMVKGNNKKVTNDNSTENPSTISTALEEPRGTSIQNNVMKINSLLPVLHSHINTYNKKNNQANKSTTSYLEVPVSTVTKDNELENETDGEDKPYSCKGNLKSYKKGLTVPTITDQYLKRKKVNIVKIEYVIGGPMRNKLQNNDSPCQQEEKTNCSIETDNQSKSAEYKQVDEDSKQNKIEAVNLNNDLTPTCSLTQIIKNSNDINIEAADKTEIVNLNLTCNLEQPLTNQKEIHNKVKTVAIKSLKKTAAENDQLNYYSSKNVSKSTLPNTEIELENMAADNPSLSTTDTFLPQESTNKCEPVIKINIADCSPKEEMITSTNKSEETIAPKKVIDTTEVVLKKPELCRKYFSFNERVSKISKVLNNRSVFISNYPNRESKQLTKDDTKSEPLPEVMVRENLEGTNCQVDKSVKVNERLNEVENTEISSVHHPELINFCNVNSISNSSENNLDLRNVAINERVNSMSTKEIDDNVTSLLENSEIGNSMDVTKPSNFHEVSRDSILSTAPPGRRSSLFNRKQQTGIGHLLEELRSNDSVISVESLDSDCSEFITKRQRKRVRKRRKKITDSSDTSLNDSSLIVTEAYIPKPMNSKACPSMHFKFEEDNGEVLKIIDVTKQETKIGNKSCTAMSSIENITIESDLDETNLGKFHIKEQDILKSPSMKNMLPKIGDFIAFKILRITENYTPQISSYITGKVVDFDTENKQVVYEILDGLDQCEEPKGKLSLDIDADNLESKKNQREFAWIDIMDPRLLFP